VFAVEQKVGNALGVFFVLLEFEEALVVEINHVSLLLFNLYRSFGPGIAVHPVVLILQASIALEGEEDVALAKLQRAVGTLGFDRFAVDPHLFLGIDADGGDSGAGIALGHPLPDVGGWGAWAVRGGVGEACLGVFCLALVDIAALGFADLSAAGLLQLFAIGVVDGVGRGLRRDQDDQRRQDESVHMCSFAISSDGIVRLR
jgi:hypothetical protein